MHGNVKSVSKERLEEVAICELNGVSQADFLIALLPGGKGTHIELGFAIASGKKVFIHSEDPTLFEVGPQTCAFYHHPSVTRLDCPLKEIGAIVSSILAESVLL